MSEHYERVLAVKQEIMGRGDIRAQLIENYEGFYMLHSESVHREFKRRIRGRQMNHSDNRFLFRAGQLGNEELLVNKLFISGKEVPRLWLPQIANECQEAAEMLEEGFSVPYVTMIVVYEGIYGTLTTDVTEGGLHTIIAEDLNYVTLEKNDGTIQKVWTDLKRETPRDDESAKKYLEEALLIL